MKRALVVATVVTALTCALRLSPALAVPGPGCLAAPLPAGPGSNLSFSMEVQDVDDRMSVTFWRQRCRDSQDDVLLLRATPTSTAPFLCGNRWYLDQDERKFFANFSSAVPTGDGGGSAFCSRITAATTVVVTAGELSGGEPGPFDNQGAFTLLFYGSFGGPYVIFDLAIPLARPGSPTIRVVSTRCNPCHPGQTVAFDGNVDNPGPPIQAEIKAGARLPDGSVASLVNKLVTLASGASVVTLIPAQSLPAALPTASVLIEAALLDPVLGRTLSRHQATLQLSP